MGGGGVAEVHRVEIAVYVLCSWLCTHTHSIAGNLGACSPGKCLKFRPSGNAFESASEPIRGHHNHAKFMASSYLVCGFYFTKAMVMK